MTERLPHLLSPVPMTSPLPASSCLFPLKALRLPAPKAETPHFIPPQNCKTPFVFLSSFKAPRLPTQHFFISPSRKALNSPISSTNLHISPLIRHLTYPHQHIPLQTSPTPLLLLMVLRYSSTKAQILLTSISIDTPLSNPLQVSVTLNSCFLLLRIQVPLVQQDKDHLLLPKFRYSQFSNTWFILFPELQFLRGKAAWLRATKGKQQQKRG